MPTEPTLTSQVSIKVNGAAIQQDARQKLLELVVDQHTHLPHMFTIRFQDPGLELLDGGTFDLTKEVEIEGQTEDGETHTLIKGEITALEPDFREGMNSQLIVRGYDKLHRLYRETKSRAFENQKDSDVANKIAQDAGLQAEVESTTTVYKHLYQHNQTDLDFLMQRAWRIGYECFVDDDKLFFRKPPDPSGGVTLTWGQELLSFRPRMTLAEQVDEVIVKGWNPDDQQPIVGRSNNGSLYPQISESRNGAQWAGSFGTGKKIIVDQTVMNQAEADLLAAARLDEVSGAFVQAEGEAFRRPDIRAGRAVDLQGLGDRFCGSYLVTSVTHRFTASGLREYFKVSGSRMGLLSEQLTLQQPLDRWPGVAPAVVTDTNDPDDVGRVKLKFPWMADDVSSTWARVMGAGAGNEAGLFIVPDVGDEVLVSFINGDFDQPCVLGGLWSKTNKMPGEVPASSSGEKPQVRTWHSKTGHILAVYDNSDNKIEILTSGGRSIVLSDKDKKITLSTSAVTITLEDNKLEIDGGTEISLKASSKVTLKADAELKLEGANINIEASGMVAVKGASVQLG